LAQTLPPDVAAAGALALFWTEGASSAKAWLTASCNDPRLPTSDSKRKKACAHLTFAAVSDANHLKTGGRGPFLPGQKLFIAMVSINGLPAEPFIVDTGAPMSVISKRYAERVGLPFNTASMHLAEDAAGTKVELFPTVLDSVTWGEIVVEHVPVQVLQLPDNFKVGGLIAPQDLLRGTAFEMDGPSASLRTLDGAAFESSLERVPLLWDEGNLFVMTEAASLASLPYLLDSGAGGNGVCDEALATSGASLDGGSGAASGTAGGTQAVRVGLSAPFRVGREAPAPTSLFTASCPRRDSGLQKSGYVGAPWFWQRRVFFPADRKTLSFSHPAP